MEGKMAERTKKATIRFLSDWREETNGEVRAGAKFRLEYALDRLPGSSRQGVVAEIVFEPGGQHHSGRVVAGKFDVNVPDDAREMMIWFHRANGDGTSWDSRFGENYRFAVTR
jgi:hypothetical protein